MVNLPYVVEHRDRLVVDIVLRCLTLAVESETVGRIIAVSLTLGHKVGHILPSLNRKTVLRTALVVGLGCACHGE